MIVEYIKAAYALLQHPHKKKQKMPQNNLERVIPTLEEAKQIWSELGLMPKHRQDGPIEKAFMAAKAAQMKAEPCDPSWRWGHECVVNEGECDKLSAKTKGHGNEARWVKVRRDAPEGWAYLDTLAKTHKRNKTALQQVLAQDRPLLAEYRRRGHGKTYLYVIAAVNALLDMKRVARTRLKGEKRLALWAEMKPPLPV